QALGTVARTISRFRSQRLGHLLHWDDGIVVAASLCALGSTVVIATAVHSGLGKQRCLLNPIEVEQIQLKLFVSTMLFVLAVAIPKCSILLFLYRVAGRMLRRVGAVAIGLLVLLWTIALLAGIVFQCEMPTPWQIWTSDCIPMISFWRIAILGDVALDLAIVILSTYTVWASHIPSHLRLLATSFFSLRLILVAASIVRLFHLQRVFNPDTDPTLESIPYIITTQCQSSLAVLLACSLALPPLAKFPQGPHPQPPQLEPRHSKHWSGTTIGGTPYESYGSPAATSPIIKEPLTSIQASMSTPNSPSTSRRNSLPQHDDVLLPEIPRYTKAPPRPPPPSEAQRPDLS
ncbi:hypothetical protein BDW02DRAFT_475522, partial [Decorospora gaudefroyi]